MKQGLGDRDAAPACTSARDSPSHRRRRGETPPPAGPAPCPAGHPPRWGWPRLRLRGAGSRDKGWRKPAPPSPPRRPAAASVSWTCSLPSQPAPGPPPRTASRQGHTPPRRAAGLQQRERRGRQLFPATAAARRPQRRGPLGGAAALGQGLGQRARRGAARQPRAEGPALAATAAAGPSEPPRGSGAAGPKPSKPNLGRRKGSCDAAALPGVPVQPERGGGERGGGGITPAGAERGRGRGWAPARGEAARPPSQAGWHRRKARPGSSWFPAGASVPSAAAAAGRTPDGRAAFPPAPPSRPTAAGTSRRPAHLRGAAAAAGGGRTAPGAGSTPPAPSPGSSAASPGPRSFAGSPRPSNSAGGRDAAPGCRPAERGKAAAASAPQPARGGSSAGRRGGGGLHPSSRLRVVTLLAAAGGRAGCSHRSAHGKPPPKTQNILKKKPTKKPRSTGGGRWRLGVRGDRTPPREMQRFDPGWIERFCLGSSPGWGGGMPGHHVNTDLACRFMDTPV